MHIPHWTAYKLVTNSSNLRRTSILQREERGKCAYYVRSDTDVNEKPIHLFLRHSVLAAASGINSYHHTKLLMPQN
jgi:hypothetical protein